MLLLDLPLDALRPNPWNSNAQTRAEEQALAASLQKNGSVQPLLVRPLHAETEQPPDEKTWEHWLTEIEPWLVDGTTEWVWEVVDGEHRLAAMRALGWATVECVVKRLDEREARLLTETLNNARGRPLPDKQAGNCAALVALGVTPGEISLLTALPLPRVEQYVALDATLVVGPSPAVRSEEWETLTFRLERGMAATVRRALAVACEVGGTDSDNQALEYICADFLAGAVGQGGEQYQ